MTLTLLMEHFFGLYGSRNRVFLNNLTDRIGFLSIAVTDLQRAIRKQTGKKNIALALARVISRIFCIAEYFRDLSLVEALIRKYPIDQCSYCGTLPCSCSGARRDPNLALKSTMVQNNWTLSDWQTHLCQLYGPQNDRRDINELISHLAEEVIEVTGVVMKIPFSQLGWPEINQAIALELADALAWACAIASRMGIQLEATVTSRYYPRCPACKNNPCTCGAFKFDQVDWNAQPN